MMQTLSRTHSARSSARTITLQPASVERIAAPGTTVGVLTPPRAGWSLGLADNAGGMFALDGATLKVGATPLAAQPQPRILVAATDGKDAAAASIAIDVQEPLPALPLPAGARVAAIGDSLVAYNNYANVPITTNKAASSYAYGFVEWALAADPRFEFESWYDTGDPAGRNLSGANQGLFGDHLAWEQAGYGGGILGRLPAVLARAPKLLILEGGGNSINSGDTLGQSVAASTAYIIARLDAALGLARSAGIPVILVTIFPRGDWPADDARRQTILDANAWIRAQAGRSGVAGICDPYDTLAPGGVPDLAMFISDKVHLSPRGAHAVGVGHLLPIIQSAVAAGSIFEQDATVSNLLAASQARMQGTAGTRQGTTLPTGSVATGFTVQGNRNYSAIACAKEVVSGDREAQVLDITPADLEASLFGQLTFSWPTATLPAPAVGKWYSVAVKVEASGAAALSTARLLTNLRSSTTGSTNQTQSTTLDVFSTDAHAATPGNRAWWVRSKPMQVPDLGGAVCDRLASTMHLYWAKSAGPFRVKLSSPIVREIADPRPGWGYGV